MFGGVATEYSIPRSNDTSIIWFFNDANSTNDNSPYGTNYCTAGTGAAAPIFTNNAITFGGNDYATDNQASAKAYTNFNVVYSFTVSFWIKVANLSNKGWMSYDPDPDATDFGRWHLVDISAAGNSPLEDKISGTISVSANQDWIAYTSVWRNVCITHGTNAGNTKITFYIDGTETSNTVAGGKSYFSLNNGGGEATNFFVIGQYYSPVAAMTGEMDDFILWPDVELSAGDVQTNYLRGRSN